MTPPPRRLCNSRRRWTCGPREVAFEKIPASLERNDEIEASMIPFQAGNSAEDAKTHSHTLLAKCQHEPLKLDKKLCTAGAGNGEHAVFCRRCDSARDCRSGAAQAP